MAKRLVRYKRVNGALVKQFESPALVGGLVDIAQLPIVGTMGAAVIERGSNANGEYVKWAGGAMLCWGNRTHSFNTADRYQPFDQTFPAVFVGEPSGGAFHRSTPGQPMQLCNWSSYPTYVTLGFYAYGSLPSSTSALYIMWFAIGRWK